MEKETKEDESQKSPEFFNGTIPQYCKLLEDWLKVAHMQRTCATSAYFTAVNSVFNPNVRTSNASNSPRPTFFGANVNAINNNILDLPNLNFRNRVIFRTDAEQVCVAPLWKRFLAESFDFSIMLILKLVIAHLVIQDFDVFDSSKNDLDTIYKRGEHLYEFFSSVSTEFLVVEILHRIFVCLVEGYCLTKNGATPGKRLVGLKVLYCDTVIPGARGGNDENFFFMGQGAGERIIVTPGTFLSFNLALLRSCIKNFSFFLFVPFCVVVFEFEHSRTLYDIISKSIVVEKRRPQPV